MTAFFDGFFSVFQCPVFMTDSIVPMDWDGDGYVVKPAGDLIDPPDIGSAWKKVGQYLQTSMSEYEHRPEQPGQH
ncbi:MAG: hypothetical protein LBT46_13990 [Planctomycetaceae bacterium]|jgi:hypothetical protein|nr:hypothetical protein [Planctomycetaceae bacterium]